MLVLNEKDHKKELPARAGDDVEIVLFENPGAGYQWDAGTTSGMGILENRYEQGSAATGSGGHRHWLVRLNDPGKQTFRGTYRRPWERETGRSEFEVTFIVR